MHTIEKISEPQEVSMGDAYYDSATPHHFWIRWRFGVLKRYGRFLPGVGALVLDIGCGNGIVLRQLEDEFAYVGDGCELNVHAVEKLVPRRGRTFYYNIQDLSPALTGRYEAVFLMDVIEHVEDDLLFLKAAAGHLKKDGIAVINVPASPMLFSRYDTACGHKRRYTKDALMKLITDAGMEPLVINYWGGLLFPLLLLRRIVLRFTNPDKAFQRGFDPPGRCSNWFLQQCRRAELALPFSPPFGTSLIAVVRIRS